MLFLRLGLATSRETIYSEISNPDHPFPIIYRGRSALLVVFFCYLKFFTCDFGNIFNECATLPGEVIY